MPMATQNRNLNVSKTSNMIVNLQKTGTTRE
jgi:hypothetical protein